MTIEEAIEQAEMWELENADNNPTHGSEDERTFAGALTHVSKHVVYSRVSQGLIHTEIWTVQSVIDAVEFIHTVAPEMKMRECEFWMVNRPKEVYL